MSKLRTKYPGRLTHCYRHARSRRHSGENLTANNAVNQTIANHLDHIQKNNELARPPPHSKSTHDLRILQIRTIIHLHGQKEKKRKEKTILTKVLLPDVGPQVADQAAVKEPTAAPSTEQSAESRKLNPYTAGPSIPKVMLFAARLIDTHRRNTCK